MKNSLTTNGGYQRLEGETVTQIKPTTGSLIQVTTSSGRNFLVHDEYGDALNSKVEINKGDKLALILNQNHVVTAIRYFGRDQRLIPVWGAKTPELVGIMIEE